MSSGGTADSDSSQSASSLHSSPTSHHNTTNQLSTTGSNNSTSSFSKGLWPHSSTTLAFHPTGSGSSCGSLFGGSTGAHHYHQSNCDLRGASGAMAYLKSSPYAMNGIAGMTSGDLLHPSIGYPGKCIKLCFTTIYFFMT